MRYPKMILFDYGHTLLYEPGYDTLNGEKALFPYIRRNPNNVTPEQADALAGELFREMSQVRERDLEFHEQTRLRYKCAYVEISYTVPPEEAELIVWNGLSEGALMPGTAQMLKYLSEAGIRSGVVSNLSFSGRTLTERIKTFLPQQQFSFILTSSDCGFRKPHPRIFSLALQKAGLPPEDIWFCGDNTRADIEGAAQAGMFPVWYDNATGREDKDVPMRVPGCDHLHIHAWSELTDILENMKTG